MISDLYAARIEQRCIVSLESVTFSDRALSLVHAIPIPAMDWLGIGRHIVRLLQHSGAVITVLSLL